MTPTVWPWAEQANQPGAVHILRIGAANPRAVRNAAYRWGKRHGHTLEYRELGGTILIRWERQNSSSSPYSSSGSTGTATAANLARSMSSRNGLTDT